MTSHFNALTEAEQERLALLIEECGEVVQAACKILRHGYESTNPTVHNLSDRLAETNRQALEGEMGDLLHAFHRMQNAKDVSEMRIDDRASVKARKVLRWLHHQ